MSDDASKWTHSHAYEQFRILSVGASALAGTRVVFWDEGRRNVMTYPVLVWANVRVRWMNVEVRGKERRSVPDIWEREIVGLVTGECGSLSVARECSNFIGYAAPGESLSAFYAEGLAKYGPGASR